MPTCERGHLVYIAIQSILDQSYQGYEIIVIDGGKLINIIGCHNKHFGKNDSLVFNEHFT